MQVPNLPTISFSDHGLARGQDKKGLGGPEVVPFVGF